MRQPEHDRLEDEFPLQRPRLPLTSQRLVHLPEQLELEQLRPLVSGQRKGLFYGGGVAQLGVQVLGPVAVGLYSFTIAWILAKIIDKTMGFRVSAEDEMTGVDLTQHAETAYDFGSIHLGHTPGHAVTGADQELADQSAESVIGAR